MGFFEHSYAQTDPVLEDSDIRPFTASGGIGVTANAYTADGIQNRRAPAVLKTSANLNFSLFGLSSGLNLLYSTDQSGLRQNMNNLSFDASWKWLAVQVGTVSPDFSEFGLSGTTLRGGYIEATPGNWEIQLSAGQSKRKVEFKTQQGFREPAFERWTAGGRLGYAGDNDSHFFISTHYSADRKNSLDDPQSITPKENLTITPDAQLSMFDGKFTLASEVTFSAFTRDLYSAKLPTEDLGIPSFITNIFQPYTSSRVNYAGNASANLNLNQFGLQLGYERVQPGFESLGVGRVRDDQQNIRIGPSVQLFDNKLSVQSNLTLGRDNLLGTRIQTRRNTSVGTNVQYQLTNMISLSGNYNMLVNDFSSNIDTDTLQQGALGQKQTSHTFMLQPTVTIQRGELTHNVSLSGSYFKTGNEFKGSANSANEYESDTYSSSLSYSLAFPSGFALNTMGNFLMFNSRRSENISTGANVGTSYSLLDRKMNLSLNVGFNQTRNEVDRSAQNQSNIILKSRQLMLNLSSSYRIFEKGTLSLSVRSRSNNAIRGGGTNYTELEGSFSYRHRF